ncbi:MAG: Ni/Fe hydrogenase subunit alpha [Deltaproteobacteria bacterium]|nr:Ni/Fe hydrogenase subunit alpha [Deltaproteobacteria bacterium]MBW1738082.1 Ni/Fe hydrogenase subunit alpha [Deltaproteobacteria bacterium]MBW1908893.1 Ni/Fe hydrogenase subunit alpha [Deltaproteobacteria bacterium]MBW2032569.1 Ni/Fe hydrogenase subunit alpha [Deltaproteobacteria bacterium]MBW2115383.1 Ni/Fe hydrogenase subunit alpha [Deltaproteobacteria bacterium]
MRKITIDPVTRLEGHGKIEIFLDKEGEVERAYFQIPELRGFEKFCEGRPAEEMPRITQRICGGCSTAHHMASTKALDDLFKVEPTSAAKKIRELMYNSFIAEHHILHFFFLGGPDFIVGPGKSAKERNIMGVIAKAGMEAGGKIIEVRKRLRGVIEAIGGKVIHPVCGLPGGISKPVTEEERKGFIRAAEYLVEFSVFVAFELWDNIVLKNKEYLDLITGDVYKHRTYYMGLVDENNKVNFYDGHIRVVDPNGKEFASFNAQEYPDHIREHVEPWTYVKFSYLKNVGWKGFVNGEKSGVFRVGPMARLNAADGMATPLAQEYYEKMYEALGEKPAHNTLAFHWARLIELLYTSERMLDLVGDPELTSPDVINIPAEIPTKGMGVVEAPEGTLFHHYETDERGIVTGANLIAPMQNNSASICMSIEKAAKSLIHKGKVTDSILNMIEMAIRAYDPCND